jgi:hypothetical protein
VLTLKFMPLVGVIPVQPPALLLTRGSAAATSSGGGSSPAATPPPPLPPPPRWYVTNAEDKVGAPTETYPPPGPEVQLLRGGVTDPAGMAARCPAA